MACWDQNDEKEFMAGIMAAISGSDVKPAKDRPKAPSKAAVKRRGKKQAPLDTSTESPFEKSVGKRALNSDPWDLDSSPEKSFGSRFGSFEMDTNDFEGIASTLQQDLEREMAKKKKAKTASIAAHSQKCNEMIKSEEGWFQKEIENLRQKEKKENEMLREELSKLQQDCDKLFRQWSKVEGSLKKEFDALNAEEATFYQSTKEKAADLLNKTEPIIKDFRVKIQAVHADKKKKEEDLEKVLHSKMKIAEKVIFKIHQMAV